MFSKFIKYLIRILLFLLVIIILASVFGSFFKIDVETFKENSFSIITIVGLALIIVSLIWWAKVKLDKSIDSIEPLFTDQSLF